MSRSFPAPARNWVCWLWCVLAIAVWPAGAAPNLKDVEKLAQSCRSGEAKACRRLEEIAVRQPGIVGTAAAEKLVAVFAGQDQVRLLQLAVNGGTAGLRLMALKQISDPQVLERAALEDRDGAVRLFAVRRLSDSAALGRVATLSDDFGVRLSAIERVSDQALLERLASDPKLDIPLRTAAIGRMTDQQVLFQIAVETREYSLALPAIRMITDQTLVLRLFFKGRWRETAVGQLHDEVSILEAAEWACAGFNLDMLHDEEACEALIRKLPVAGAVKQLAATAGKNSNAPLSPRLIAAFLERAKKFDILEDVAAGARSYGLRTAAMEILLGRAGADGLAAMARSGRTPQARLAALERLQDEALLAEIAGRDADASVRRRAVQKITRQDVLASVARRDADDMVRTAAVARLEDQAALSAVAIHGSGFPFARVTAVGRLTDPRLLAEVVLEADDWSLRRTAFGKLDNAALTRVAAKAADPAARLAASVKLGLTWSSAFEKASREPEGIGVYLGAVALLDRQDGIQDAVARACHHYIGRGDEKRLPELVHLLQLYGTRELAEDYLNCGQQRLHDAGAVWGREHGYNIGNGSGSNRVRWGAGKK
jgi:hypothetical protein